MTEEARHIAVDAEAVLHTGQVVVRHTARAVEPERIPDSEVGTLD